MRRTYSSLLIAFTKKLVIFLLVLLLLLMVGNLLANYFYDAQYITQALEKNNLLFILWRIAIYSAVILLLTPAVIAWFEQFVHLSQGINHKTLWHCRKITIISIVAYECVIVQSLFKTVVQWGYYYVSG